MKKGLFHAAALAAAWIQPAFAYTSVSNESGLNKAVQQGATYTVVLFYDRTNEDHENAKEVFKVLDKKARKREADIDFVLFNVTKGEGMRLMEMYNIEEDDLPLFALFEGDPTEFYSKSGHGHSRRVKRRIVSFIKRHTGEFLGKHRDRDDGYYHGPRVRFGIGIGHPGYYGYGYPYHHGWYGYPYHHGYYRRPGVHFGFGF